MKLPQKKHIKAGALYYVIFFGFVFSLVIGVFIFQNLLRERLIQMDIIQKQLINDIESVVTLYEHNPNVISQQGKNELELFENQLTKISCENKTWGVYDLLLLKSTFKHLKHSKIMMFGDKIHVDDYPSVYIADHDKYISVSGNVHLGKNCYLPKLGLRTANIEGQSFSGNVPKAEQLKVSTNVPALSSKITGVLGNVKQQVSGSEKIEYRNYLQLTNSFYDETIYVQCSDSITNLYQTYFKGNVVLYSDDIIKISSSNKLDNIVVYGRQVIIEENFSGCAQIFASDTIIVEPSVNLNYPSVLCVISESNPYIGVDRNVSIGGLVIASGKIESKASDAVLLEDKTQIYGQVYTDGKVQLKGNVYGSLICDVVSLRTTASYYENHLLGTTIDIERLLPVYSGVDFMGYSTQKKLITCIE